MSKAISSVRRHATVPVLIGLLLAACSSGTPASESTDAVPSSGASASPEPTASATAVASFQAASPSASEEAVAAGLSIPIESPCHAIDADTVEELIGGPIETEREWDPGDQPFGTDRPPSQNYGCLFVGAVMEGGKAPEFGLSMPGARAIPEEWEERMSSSMGDCRDLETPADVDGELVAAAVCESLSGWNNVIVHGVFDGTALLCSVFVPEDRVDEAFEGAVVDECGRIILDLAEASA